MNKKYMDFVPTNSKRTPVGKIKTVKKVERVVQKTEVVSRKSNGHEEEIIRRTVKASTPSPEDGLRFGVIEDLNPNYMGGSVEKKSLDDESEIRAIKAKKINGTVEEKKIKRDKDEKKQDYKVPKNPFIN